MPARRAPPRRLAPDPLHCAALAGVLALAGCLTLSAEDVRLPPPDRPDHPVETHATKKDPDTGQVVRFQDRLELPDGRSVKHGVERTWYPNGALRAERFFDRGEPAGHWRSWYEDGSPRSESSFVAEEQPALMRFWHPNGALSAQGLGRSGVREGAWTYWYPDGRVREEGRYVGGQRDGLWSFYREDGALEARGRYANGERVGPWEHGAPEAASDPPPDPDQ